MSACGLYAVLLRSDQRLSVPAVAPAVAKALESTLVDARHLVRNARGIFAEAIGAEQAIALVGCLEGLGIEALAIPAAALARPPKPQRVIAASPGDEAIELQTGFVGRPLQCPWHEVAMTNGAVLATRQYRDYFATKAFRQLPALHRIEDPQARKELREKLAERARRETQLDGMAVSPQTNIHQDDLETLCREHTDGVLDLYVRGGRRYRMMARELRYEYLGGRRKMSTMENFRLLLGDVVARVPEALRPPMTERFLGQEPIPAILFDSLNEFERYTMWFLYTTFQGEPPWAGSPSSSPEPAPPDSDTSAGS